MHDHAEEEYEEVRVRRGPRSGLLQVVAIHRTIAGRSLGGCRIYGYRNDDDAIADARRLSRAMTFKSACAGLGIGGGKAVIALQPGQALVGELRERALVDFAELVDSLDGRYITAQDVGTSLADIEFLARYTEHVSGHPVEDGGSGDPSPYTARGVETAIRTSVNGVLSGTHVIVLGLGNVGGDLAERLQRAGARLTVSDADERKKPILERLAGALWVEPREALDVEADVLAPCALGGVLTAETVRELKVPIVAGAANNQLAQDGIADELRRRGILWAPDFVANAGGLIAVVDELHGFDRQRVDRGIDQIGETLQTIYDRSQEAGTSTLAAAMELAERRLAPAS